MPIYEYRCEHCRHELEAFQKVSDVPLEECPECGVHTLRKLVSAVAFKLAGTGWYETDFKHNKKSERKGDADGGAGDAKSEEGDKKAGAKGDGDSGQSSDQASSTSDAKKQETATA